MFSALQSHYLFEDRFGRPGKGNDKGKVEGLVGYSRRNFMVPVPVAESFEALNEMLAGQMPQALASGSARSQDQHCGTDAGGSAALFMALPAHAFDACHIQPGRASSLSLVRYKTNDYSVPTAFAHRT